MERLDQIWGETWRPQVSPDLPRPLVHLAPTGGGLYTDLGSDGEERGPRQVLSQARNPHLAGAHVATLTQGNWWRDHWRIREPPLASLLPCSSLCLPASPGSYDGLPSLQGLV